MSSSYVARTDLAVETRERLFQKAKVIRGVEYHEEMQYGHIKISVVDIETENASKKMGKAKGRYVTLDSPALLEEDEDRHKEISKALARIIMKMIRPDELQRFGVLIVGLGNREVTPDSLGPRVIDHLFITRHVIKEFGKYAYDEADITRISGIAQGVLAQTGMESAEIIRGIVSETNPDVVIAVDALAAGEAKRLGRTIQLTNTGIVPGSGVGNHRHAITKDSIGVPVIAIGVPTVVDAASIVSDDENLPPQVNGMFVTPKNIDSSIKELSTIISEGINCALLEYNSKEVM